MKIKAKENCYKMILQISFSFYFVFGCKKLWIQFVHIVIANIFDTLMNYNRLIIKNF